MRHLLTAAALLTLAAPALAQSTAPAVPVATGDVDLALVGEWELVAVEDGGVMDELDAEIESLWLRIESDGDATVQMEVVQDLETVERQDAFHCTTEGGQILTTDRPAIAYEVLDDGEIRLKDSKGVVVRMKRTEGDVATR